MAAGSAGARSADAIYDDYVRAEWRLFDEDPHRTAAAREAVGDVSIRRVLDVGCGAGQELRPFLRDTRVFGVGVDKSASVGVAGRQLFSTEQPGARVAFVRAAAEHLPFEDGTFDVAVCRLALPYTHNARTISELGRLVRDGGVLLLTIHHLR